MWALSKGLNSIAGIFFLFQFLGFFVVVSLFTPLAFSILTISYNAAEVMFTIFLITAGLGLNIWLAIKGNQKMMEYLLVLGYKDHGEVNAPNIEIAALVYKEDGT